MAEAIAPVVNALNAPFWAAAARGRLDLPVCLDTGRAFWPPSPISPFTGGPVAWRAAEPAGTLKGMVVYRRVFQKAFEPLSPYGAALVELDAGPRLMVHVSDPATAPEPGASVRLAFRPLLEGGPAVPVLDPAQHRQDRGTP